MPCPRGNTKPAMATKCWDILGITPTSDLKLIADTRRGLIKKWHPDTVENVEEKANYTSRCAEINAAYDDAVKFASIRARLLAQIADTKAKPEPLTTYSYESRLMEMLVSFAMFIALFGLVRFTRFVVPMVTFTMGLLVAGVLDAVLFLIYRSLLRAIARRSQYVRPHEQKLAWSLLFISNLCLMRWWLAQVDFVFSSAIILATPIWLLGNQILTKFRVRPVVSLFSTKS
jgi:hypothetical protein